MISSNSNTFSESIASQSGKRIGTFDGALGKKLTPDELVNKIAIDYFTLQDSRIFSQVSKGTKKILTDKFSKKNANVINLENLGAGLIRKLIRKIAVDYFTFQDFGRFSQVSKGIKEILTDKIFSKKMCPILYSRFEDRFEECHANVINLDNLGAGRILQRPPLGFWEPESIESLRAQGNLLREAIRIAWFSENKQADIVTIPQGWSMKDLEKLSQTAVNAGIPSAKIRYSDSLIDWGYQCSEILGESTIQETQRVVISNTVLKGSRGKSIQEQEKLLIDMGFEFPNLLLTLTLAVLKRILSRGKESSYCNPFSLKLSITHTNTKTPEGITLCVYSNPDCVHVVPSKEGNNNFGVGAMKIAPI